MTQAIKITDEALLEALGPLPDGYGPDVYFGPCEDGPHVWFSGSDGEWNKANVKDSFRVFHAYKREPVKRVVWLNVYPDRRDNFTHQSRVIADRFASANRIACVRVEFEEGPPND